MGQRQSTDNNKITRLMIGAECLMSDESTICNHKIVIFNTDGSSEVKEISGIEIAKLYIENEDPTNGIITDGEICTAKPGYIKPTFNVENINHFLGYLKYDISNVCMETNPCQHDVKFTDFNDSNYEKTITMWGTDIYELLKYTGADMTLEDNKHFLD